MAKPCIAVSDCGSVCTISGLSAAQKLTITLSGDAAEFAVDSVRVRLRIIEVKRSDSESGFEHKSESTREEDLFFCREFADLLKQKPHKIKIKKIFDEPNLLKFALKCTLSNIYGAVHNTGVFITDVLEIEWAVLPSRIVTIKRNSHSST